MISSKIHIIKSLNHIHGTLIDTEKYFFGELYWVFWKFCLTVLQDKHV